MDVAEWLRGLGLTQYESAFRANDVDAEVLPELTAEDLIGLGVTSIGHRRKLLAAIAALGADAPLRPSLPIICRRSAAPLSRALSRGPMPSAGS
jgi:SAM domain (Sterile alpha motif)